MSPPRPVVQSGAFVRGDTGTRFRLLSEPSDGDGVRGTVIFVHAFAEEMNKSRRMAARMARLLASDGWRVVQRDLCGCGDSPGEFADASWAEWTGDVAAELAQASRALPVWLWCLRAGALLTPAVLSAHPHAKLLLWQPVMSGAQHLQQFLRLHAGARIVGAGKPDADQTPAQMLRSGRTVEVGGYQLSPALATGLERATFALPPEFTGRIVWFEVSGDEVPALSPPAARAIELLRERELAVEAHALPGPPFWQTQEIEECAPLLEQTLAALRTDDTVPSAAIAADSPPIAPLVLTTRADDAKSVDEVIEFTCGQDRLWGILSPPPAGTAESPTAVLVIVGGPQYRVGSHRQFVLLARRLAAAGHATLRFDYAGMGDSEGERRNFEACGPDIAAALDALCRACPNTTRVVVWGLCDAASAALMFATADARVAGIVAVNPWARSAASLAAAHLKHYYAARIVQREFWAKLVRGGLDWRASLGSLAGNLKGARSKQREPTTRGRDDSFQAKMARGLATFGGRVLLILSGNDLTAREFIQYTASSLAWKGLLADRKLSRVDLPEADHTFSRRTWLNAAEDHTIAWLKGLDAAAPTRTNNMR